MMNWLKEVFKTEKPIIAMCHLQALPGDSGYDQEKGMEWVIEKAREDLHALQDGGVDAVMFSNEFSLPYLTDVKKETLAAMGRVIGEIKSEITVPFGVNVLWDAKASLDLAVATGACFVREIFTGVYASDFGLWNTNCGETVRHQHAVGAQNVKLLFNIVPEAAVYVEQRNIREVADVYKRQGSMGAFVGRRRGYDTGRQGRILLSDRDPAACQYDERRSPESAKGLHRPGKSRVEG